MIPGLVIDSVLRGVLGGRHKRSRGAMRFLGGNGSLWSNPQVLLTAAGVAWGIFETLQPQPDTSTPAGSGPSPTGGSAGVTPPPVPAGAATPTAAQGGAADEALRLVRLAISAAHADGTMNEHERAAIVQQASAAGAGDLVGAELESPRPLKEIVAGVTDPAAAATLYVLAFTILRADEQLTGAERIYLAQLAHLLQLDREKVAALEKNVGERIDALGDQGQLGG